MSNPILDMMEGPTPDDVTSAIKKTGDQSFNGWCEAFAEEMAGEPNMGGSASEAWQNYVKQGRGVSGMNGIKSGDLIYFNDPNHSAGHVGIYKGNNSMISATDNGVAESNIDKWTGSTGQTINGYVTQNPILSMMKGIN